jgi:hypothetical protein
VLTINRISTHYQWIIMLIVLLLAAIGAVILGLWFKRRQDRKWSSGGYARDSMLRTADVAGPLASRHPQTSVASMSQLHMPSYNENVYMSGSREYLAESSNARAATMSGGNYREPSGDLEKESGHKLKRPESALKRHSSGKRL